MSRFWARLKYYEAWPFLGRQTSALACHPRLHFSWPSRNSPEHGDDKPIAATFAVDHLGELRNWRQSRPLLNRQLFAKDPSVWLGPVGVGPAISLCNAGLRLPKFCAPGGDWPILHFGTETGHHGTPSDFAEGWNAENLGFESPTSQRYRFAPKCGAGTVGQLAENVLM